MTFITKIMNKLKSNFALSLVLIPIVLFLIGFSFTALIVWITGNAALEEDVIEVETTAASETIVEIPLVRSELDPLDLTVYVLQVASFSSQEGAEASVQQLQSKNIYSNWVHSGSQYKVFSALSTDDRLVKSYRDSFVDQHPEHSDAFVTELNLSLKNLGYTSLEAESEELQTLFEAFYSAETSIWLQLMGTSSDSSGIIDSSLSKLQKIVEILVKYEENIDTEFTNKMQDNYDAFKKLKADNAQFGAFMAEFSNQLLELTTVK